MGRPINKKYFGNINQGSLSTTTDNGIGGQGVATVAVDVTANGPYETTATVVFSKPQIRGGVTAKGTLVINADTGAITGLTITEKGSGYTVAPTLTVTPATTGTATTFTVTLTTPEAPAMTVSAWVKGGTSAKTGDIQKQEASARYRVATEDGIGICKLVGKVPAEGEMTITATDSDGGTYYVTKLTARKAILVPITGTQFANTKVAGWNFSAAVPNVSVKIGNA